ncbi:MAG: hypothetical protein E7221_01585 [Clostridiales bacterium]|nr:hypothetical protein [Clostridiales bacterium]MBQ3322381.1 hypothetical protein [Bacillota bacterium]
MTIVGIIAIVVMGILCILCVVCIAVILGNRRQASANNEAIRDIEKSLSSFGDSIKEQTGQLIEHLEQQQSNDNQERRLELLEEEVRRLSRFDEIDLPDDVEGVFNKPEGPEEIEELGDDVELDDLLAELNALSNALSSETQEAPESPKPVQQPTQQEQPALPPEQPVQQMATPQQPAEEILEETRYHQGYNIGRSGKRYTAEELNLLIRE